MAKKADNIEFLSLSIAYKAFVTFLSNADPKEFNLLYERYDYLKNQNDPDFNHRYDQIMEVAKAAYDGKYNEALDFVKNGKVNVDSALTVVRIYGLSGDMNNTFEAMSRLYSDLDSVFSITQNANFDELTTERQLVLSQEEAAINKKLVKRMTNWFIILVLIFLIVYIMGRRRLVRKIWVKNKELKDALEKAEEGSRMKSRIISGIGRELRTPLNVVAGFSQVLSSPDFNPTEKERQDMHQRITENVDKINSAIDRLVELSDDKEE
jgi:signal transduction histidine kinase